jgi:hypothetical protein
MARRVRTPKTTTIPASAMARPYSQLTLLSSLIMEAWTALAVFFRSSLPAAALETMRLLVAVRLFFVRTTIRITRTAIASPRVMIWAQEYESIFDTHKKTRCSFINNIEKNKKYFLFFSIQFSFAKNKFQKMKFINF